MKYFMEEKNNDKKHIEQVYTDKACFLLKICIGLLVFDEITYVYMMSVYNNFDFGFIFESISLMFVLLAIVSFTHKRIKSGKAKTIIAIIPIGLLIIYDAINLLINIKEVLGEVARYYLTGDALYYCIKPYLVDVILVLLMGLLIKAYLAICKADGTKKTDDYAESFYDKL